MPARKHTQWLSEPSVEYVDSRIYSSWDIFNREQEKIFKKCWIPLCHESELVNHLDFRIIDKKKFPSINILKLVSGKSSLYETVIVSANDLLVQFFLEGKIKFLDIERFLKKVIKLREFNKFKHISPTSVNQIIKLNKYVRLKTQSLSVLSKKP